MPPIARVSDLVSLQLIEQTVARETSPEMSRGGPEGSTNIIVLDDVSPRYTKATTALQACDVGLGIALRSPLEVRGHASPENASGRLRAPGCPDLRRDQPQWIASSFFDEPPDFFLACLPRRKRMSISVPLTRTSSHRR
jgi:hypothetical protein